MEGTPASWSACSRRVVRLAALVTDGLRWRLDGDELVPGSTRGLSNEFVGATATVRVGEGVVLVVRPGPEA